MLQVSKMYEVRKTLRTIDSMTNGYKVLKKNLANIILITIENKFIIFYLF